MIGFSFKENFGYPFTARSVTDFWRRWHISLASFFRDYVYIPLGGNKRRPLINILIVWGLTGLWHGANWNYVAWGLYFGLLLVFEKAFLLNALEKLPPFAKHAYALVLISCSWPIFCFPSAARLFEFARAAVDANADIYDVRAVSVLGTNALLLPVLIIGSTTLPRKAVRFINEKFTWGLLEPVGNAVIMAASFAAIIGQSYSPFLYFRF